MPDLETLFHTVALPIWAVGAALIGVVLVAAVAVARIGSRQNFGFFAQAAALVLLVGVAWVYLDRLDRQDRAEQRRAIEARLSALTAQALLPKSNLACLDGDAGEAVQESCEKALYESPEQVAAALTYVGARADLLRDIAATSDTSDDSYMRIRAQLARGLAADRFGMVAQVLSTRDGCTPEKCDLFDLVQRRDQLIANMADRAYDAKVVRYAAGWGEKQPSGPALAASTPSPPTTGNPVNINFPSASSIPPVSIMANEPGMPGQNGMDSTAAKPEPRQQQQPQQQQKRAAQKQQAPRPAAPQAQPSADPFPLPLSSAQQTTGAPGQGSPQ